MKIMERKKKNVYERTYYACCGGAGEDDEEGKKKQTACRLCFSGRSLGCVLGWEIELIAMSVANQWELSLTDEPRAYRILVAS